MYQQWRDCLREQRPDVATTVAESEHGHHAPPSSFHHTQVQRQDDDALSAGYLVDEPTSGDLGPVRLQEVTSATVGGAFGTQFKSKICKPAKAHDSVDRLLRSLSDPGDIEPKLRTLRTAAQQNTFMASREDWKLAA